MPRTLLIRNADILVTMDSGRREIAGGAVLIEDNRIVAVGPSAELPATADEVLDLAGHIVLRGGRARTNYDAASIRDAEAVLAKAKLPTGLMVDCSHANSGKVAARQEDVWRSLIEQRVNGSKALIGAMIESHIHEGAQPFPRPASELAYGVSITDACIGWETTERLVHYACELLRTPAPAAV